MQPERRDDQAGGEVVIMRKAFCHLRPRISHRMITQCNSDFGKIFARRAEFMHVPLRAKSMRRDRTEIAVFGTEFGGVLIVGTGLILYPRLGGGMRARPGVAAITAKDGGRKTRLNSHHGERHRENLAGAAIVQRSRETRGNTEAFSDLLVLAIGVVGAAGDQA